MNLIDIRLSSFFCLDLVFNLIENNYLANSAALIPATLPNVTLI